MTGFGEASQLVDGVYYSVQLRSLNNRYFKALLRLPDQIVGLEAELEPLLRNKLSRGSVTATVRMVASGASAASRVNDDVVLIYLDHLETIHDKVRSRDHSVNIDLTALLALPGVLQPHDDDSALLHNARPIVLELADQAIQGVQAMRTTEGKIIADDLAQQRCVILAQLGEIQQRAPRVIEEYHMRLRARIDELLARAEMTTAEPDLIREVALFADRADITEELSRLAGHQKHFEQVIESCQQSPVGRMLDFIAQEMLREANTIASKSNDNYINHAVLEIKSAVERIKEQVQNVE